MGVAPEEFWGSNYYNHPPLTDEMVAETERQLGVRLPAEYLVECQVKELGCR